MGELVWVDPFGASKAKADAETVSEVLAVIDLEATTDAVSKSISRVGSEVGTEVDVEAVSEDLSDVFGESSADTIGVEVDAVAFFEANSEAMTAAFAEASAEAVDESCGVVTIALDRFVFSFDDPDDLRKKLYRPKVVLGTFSLRE